MKSFIELYFGDDAWDDESKRRKRSDREEYFLWEYKQKDLPEKNRMIGLLLKGIFMSKREKKYLMRSVKN